MTTKKNAKFDFEASLRELEAIVGVIEQGGLGLEASLRSFAQGVELVKKCQQVLKESEQKVKILMKDHLLDFELKKESGDDGESDGE